jgi:hypothetical protein
VSLGCLVGTDQAGTLIGSKMATLLPNCMCHVTDGCALLECGQPPADQRRSAGALD